MSEHIRIERPADLEGRVQTIRIVRPDKKNALTRPMYAAMTAAFKAGDNDDAVRAHVVLGTAGAFSAGNDMQDFRDYAEGGALGQEVIDFLHALADVTKPVVCGVDGLAIGIGTTMQLHCDLTFATPRSLFRTPFVDLALVPEAASSLLAPRLMGHQRAFALLAAGEGLSAEEALSAGLIYRIVEEGELEPQVFKAASALARKPPQALRLARDLLRGSTEAIRTRIDEEVGQFAGRLRTDEAKAALEAFFDRKR